MEAHDAPYWPAAWTAVHIDIHHLGSSLRFISFSQAPRQINGRDKVAVVGRCSPRPRPSTDPDMAARLRLQLRLQLQLQSQLEYGSFRANDIKKHIMAPLWKDVVIAIVVCCVPGMRFGQKAKGRSTANCCGTLICNVKSSANPAHFAVLSALCEITMNAEEKEEEATQKYKMEYILLFCRFTDKLQIVM